MPDPVEPDAFDPKRVGDAWRACVEGRPYARRDVRDVIAESWERCRTGGVDPREQRAPHLGAGLDAARSANAELLHAAQSTWELLSASLIASDSIFIVASPEGVLLDVRGNAELVEAAAREHVAPGYDWSESASGTNAVGTALATDRPTLVRTTEHFCEGAKIWDCAASLVRDLSDGTLLGVLDVTSIGDLSDSHTLALAVTAAQQIEHTLHSQDLARSVQLLNWYRSAAAQWRDRPTLLLDRKGRVITASDAAQTLAAPLPDACSVENGRPRIAPGAGLRVTEFHAYRWPRDLELGHVPSDWEGGVIAVEPERSAGGAPGRATHEPAPAFARIITADPALQATMRQAARMARANSPILITGETGCGKEVFASAIHASSNVAGGPFVAVNCGTLTKELATSELLGYEPGAFTGASAQGRRGKFEEADGGTLFLDEVGELPADVQVHLLRVLQDNVVVRVGGNTERRVSVRILAATNRDLDRDAAEGRFRSDLYYRLKVLSLTLPPLRERRDDVPLLVEAFLRRLQGTYGLGARSASPELLEALRSHDWPGNVRELQGLVESLYVLSTRPLLTTADLPDRFREQIREQQVQTTADVPAGLDRVERDAIARELALGGRSMAEVAKRLGISRSTLYRKIKQYELDR